MIAAVSHKYETGDLQAYCVDSIDSESWYNKAISPAERVRRHMQYEQYLLDEVLPFILARNQSPRVAVTGCSFGGYHTINFALRHPDLVSDAISMGGAFDIHQFLDGYYDENCYFHCPPDYLSGLNDERYLAAYRQSVRIVLATGETDMCLDENRRLSSLMNQKQRRTSTPVGRASHDVHLAGWCHGAARSVQPLTHGARPADGCRLQQEHGVGRRFGGSVATLDVIETRATEVRVFGQDSSATALRSPDRVPRQIPSSRPCHPYRGSAILPRSSHA